MPTDHHYHHSHVRQVSSPLEPLVRLTVRTPHRVAAITIHQSHWTDGAALFTHTQVTKGALGLADLGVEATPMERVGIRVLRRYRKHIYHDDLVEDVNERKFWKEQQQKNPLLLPAVGEQRKNFECF
jgi:hypothetical protein